MSISYGKEIVLVNRQRSINQDFTERIELGTRGISGFVYPLEIEIGGTFFPSLYSNKGIAFRGLVLNLIGQEVKSLVDKKNCPLYSFTTFRDQVRSNENATESYALVFDYDHKTKNQALDILRKLNLMGIAYILYSTFSMMDEGEIAFRVIVFYSRAVSIEEAEKDYYRFVAIFNGEVDPSTKDRARAYFQRAIQKGFEKYVRFVVKAGLSIEAFKDAFPELPCDDFPLLDHVALHVDNVNNSSRLNLPGSSLDFVFSKCEALRNLYLHSHSNELKHKKGLALAWFMMNFSGWEKRIKLMKGWGVSKKHWLELEQSFRAGYVGHNCKELIKLGICKRSSSCFIYGGAVKDKFFKPHPILFANGASNDSSL